jgi:glycosyltransferase involved in cell wall biosynthesis
MKVAYVTAYNSGDIRNWSGTGYFIAESLKRQGVELIRINCFTRFPIFQRIKRKLIKVLANRLLLIERETSYLKKIAQKAKHELSCVNYDIIFCPGSLPATYLDSDKPIVIFTDATYDCLMRLYLPSQHLSTRSILKGNQAEAAAIQKASLLIYPSEWAIDSALKKYQADPQKVLQIGFGANISCQKPAIEIKKMITRRKLKQVKNFLFIGVDWHRKGAKKAIETIAHLNEKGLKATITLVGCKIPNGVHLPDFVVHYPFISKSDQTNMDQLNTLFENADFFILPTRADCSPIVFSEAASYALPVITTEVGGCTSVIIDNQTGFCIKEENFVEEASKTIIELCNSENAYETISLNAYNHYLKELNWDVIGEKLVKAMQRLVHPTNILQSI